MRRRLCWPLPLTRHKCRGKHCRQTHDHFGDHPASCPRSGLLKRRSRPIEKIWARILREAGARIRENVSLHEAGVAVDVQDGRNIEIVAAGLPIHQGVPLAIDATMVSPLQTGGEPHPQAQSRIGVALARARRAKESTYPELLTSSRLRLLVAAIEVGGRISAEAARVFEMPPLRFQVAMRRRLRWPSPLTRHKCGGKRCRQTHDHFGDHPSSCPRSGLLKRRSRPIEKI